MASPRVAGDVYVSGADFGVRAVGLAGRRRFDGNLLAGAIPSEIRLLTSMTSMCVLLPKSLVPLSPLYPISCGGVAHAVADDASAWRLQGRVKQPADGHSAH